MSNYKHKTQASSINAISRLIHDSYLPNLDTLPPKERIHFTRRAYRLTGDSHLAARMSNSAHQHTIPKVKERAKILDSVVYSGHSYPKVKFKPTRSPRTAARNALFERRPELQFFRRYLMDLFQAKSSGLHQSALAQEWPNYIETLQQIDFDSMYVDLEVISKVSSFAVNSVIFLNSLGIDNSLHRRFIGYLKGAYLEDDLTLAEELSLTEYRSFIYNLTHVVIAYSDFYQKWVSRESWIATYFADNVDTILKNCTHDIIAEVGLCIKLQKSDSRYLTEYRKILDHLVETYDFDANLRIDQLKRREHTNAVIMLLFGETSEWHQGPYIA